MFQVIKISCELFSLGGPILEVQVVALVFLIQVPLVLVVHGEYALQGLLSVSDTTAIGHNALRNTGSGILYI